jgi:hypothetical protein
MRRGTIAMEGERMPKEPSPQRPQPPSPKQPATAAGAATPGVPVNPLSRAVNPRLQYPLHFDLLMRDLFAHGMQPEKWQVIAAEEVRLDESGMDIEFTMAEHGSDRVMRSRVDVQHGKLLRIRHL